jgi:peptidoglycan/LPS O-acetylase OafA/YrhL
MAVHASQAAPEWTGVGRTLVDQGARGVQLFFVASALTLKLSWDSRNDGLFRFYARRVFRIGPMFWLGIVFFVWLDGYGPRYFAPNGINENHVILTSLLLHGWHPEYITSVVHGEWSIAVEMAFYLVFPVAIFFIRGGCPL